MVSHKYSLDGRKMKHTTLFMIMIPFFVLGNVSSFAEEIELPLATGEWPPYTSKKIEGYGFCTEIVSAIVHEMDMKPKYYFYPWKRAENVTREGRVLGAFPYAVTEERKKEFDYSDLIMENKTVFFYNKKHLNQKPVWITLKDLKPFRIGGVIGYSYTSTFTKAGLKVQYVPLDENNVGKLYLNRIDLAVMDLLVGWNLIRELYPNEIDIFGTLDKPLDTGNSHLMISRKYPNAKQLRDRFNQALKRIKERNLSQDF